MADAIMVAKESFWYNDHEGTPQLVPKGARFREGHHVMKGRTSLFEEDKSVREVEEIKRGPGRPRKTES